MTREQKSAFHPILESLVSSVPGASAAIFTDAEGESIEFCGDLSPYDIKVIGAYASIIVPQLAAKGGSPPNLVVLSCRKLTLYLKTVEEYLLTLVLKKRTFTAGLETALEHAARRFAGEAGLKR